MKRFFCVFLVLLLCLVCVPSPADAADVSTPLRIGLYYGSSSLSSVTLSGSAGYALGTVNGTAFSPLSETGAASVTIRADGSRFVVSDASGNAVYQTNDDTLAIRPLSGAAQLKDYTYRGDFILRRNSSGSLTVLNYVSLEDYVKGVLPYEMSASWPAEALKAQAVCTRSFALGNRNKHKSLGFDLCNTTNCQVYRGTSRASSATDAAADATKGEYLMAGGKLAIGYFFSSDGGATENNENVWGGDAIAYLRGVTDPYEDVSAAYNGSWSVTLTAAQAAAKLKAAGYSIGTVSDIRVTRRTAMDNVNEVTVTDTFGKTVVLKNSAVRSVFGLNSIRYTISGGTPAASGGLSVNGSSRTDGGFYAVGGDGTIHAIGSVSGKTALTGSGKQTLSVAENAAPSVPADSFTFTGTGWGHNVGMSQYGAKGMAEKGFSYDQILKFYFTGITIAR